MGETFRGFQWLPFMKTERFPQPTQGETLGNGEIIDALWPVA
jgi:hypothetical protein